MQHSTSTPAPDILIGLASIGQLFGRTRWTVRRWIAPGEGRVMQALSLRGHVRVSDGIPTPQVLHCSMNAGRNALPNEQQSTYGYQSRQGDHPISGA